MAAIPAAAAGTGFGSALKGASQAAAPSILQQLGQGGLGGGGQQAQPGPFAPSAQPQSFQIQPIVSSGSSASPLNFSAGSATGAAPANNMNPQLMRLIQLMNSIGQHA